MSASVFESDFEAVALPHLEAVGRFARSLARESADADDLVQETFLRAQRGWHTFAPGSEARPWLFTICRHAFISMQRGRQRYVESEDGDLDAIPAVRLHAQLVADGLGDLFDRMDVRSAVRRAVDALPEPHHTILVLVDIDERSYQEAAALLAVPIGTVRSRLYRARRMIQETLRVYAQDAGLRGMPLASTPAAGTLHRVGTRRRDRDVARDVAQPLTRDGGTAPIDCETAMRHLWAYLDDALTVTDTEAVRAHVETCVRCQPHVAFETRLLHDLAALSVEEPTHAASVRERLLERLRAAGIGARPRNRQEQQEQLHGQDEQD